jgi:hypothetical protein
MNYFGPVPDGSQVYIYSLDFIDLKPFIPDISGPCPNHVWRTMNLKYNGSARLSSEDFRKGNDMTLITTFTLNYDRSKSVGMGFFVYLSVTSDVDGSVLYYTQDGTMSPTKTSVALMSVSDKNTDTQSLGYNLGPQAWSSVYYKLWCNKSAPRLREDLSGGVNNDTSIFIDNTTDGTLTGKISFNPNVQDILLFPVSISINGVQQQPYAWDCTQLTKTPFQRYVDHVNTFIKNYNPSYCGTPDGQERFILQCSDPKTCVYNIFGQCTSRSTSSSLGISCSGSSIYSCPQEPLVCISDSTSIYSCIDPDPAKAPPPPIPPAPTTRATSYFGPVREGAKVYVYSFDYTNICINYGPDNAKTTPNHVMRTLNDRYGGPRMVSTTPIYGGFYIDQYTVTYDKSVRNDYPSIYLMNSAGKYLSLTGDTYGDDKVSIPLNVQSAGYPLWAVGNEIYCGVAYMMSLVDSDIYCRGGDDNQDGLQVWMNSFKDTPTFDKPRLRPVIFFPLDDVYEGGSCSKPVTNKGTDRFLDLIQDLIDNHNPYLGSPRGNKLDPFGAFITVPCEDASSCLYTLQGQCTGELISAQGDKGKSNMLNSAKIFDSCGDDNKVYSCDDPKTLCIYSEDFGLGCYDPLDPKPTPLPTPTPSPTPDPPAPVKAKLSTTLILIIVAVGLVVLIGVIFLIIYLTKRGSTSVTV